MKFVSGKYLARSAENSNHYLWIQPMAFRNSSFLRTTCVTVMWSHGLDWEILHIASVPWRTPTVCDISPHTHAIERASGHVWEISANATSLLVKQHLCSYHGFFSFPITWQMRLIWSVNAIHRLPVKLAAFSSWCIVRAAVEQLHSVISV